LPILPQPLGKTVLYYYFCFSLLLTTPFIYLYINNLSIILYKLLLFIIKDDIAERVDEIVPVRAEEPHFEGSVQGEPGLVAEGDAGVPRDAAVPLDDDEHAAAHSGAR
jgi:hypothetical protein